MNKGKIERGRRDKGELVFEEIKKANIIITPPI